MTDEHLLAFSLLPQELALQQSTATGAPAVQAMTHQRRSPPWTRGLLRCLPLTGILPVLAEHIHLLDRPGRRTCLTLDTIAADRTPKRKLLPGTVALEQRYNTNRPLGRKDAERLLLGYQSRRLATTTTLASALAHYCLVRRLRKPS